MQNDDRDLQNAARATTTATGILCKTRKSIAPATQNNFRHMIKQVGMSQSAAPATQNDMTTCLETFEKEMFCSFPHRHGEATGKPAFRARPPPILTLCSFNIDVFLRVLIRTWTFATSKSMFRAMLPSISSITSHKMPCLPRNLHLVATWRSPDNVIRKKHATRHVESAAPATQNDDGHVQSVAPATKTATHLLKMSQKYCAYNTKRLSARCQTRLNEQRHMWNFQKRPLCRSYHRHGHTGIARTVADGCGRLRTVADGCGRLRTVANGWATSSEHTLNPQTPRVKREPLLRIQE